MTRVSELIIKQSKLLLENKRHAIVYAAVFSIMPFASWISVALVMLVTLRKGAKTGFEVMLPALVIHSVPLIMLMPLDSALLNAFLAYVPSFFVALVLRQTVSWQATFGVMFAQAFIVSLLIQCIAPDFAFAQLNQLQKILSQYQEYETLIGWDNNESRLVLAQLFLGIQMLVMVVSTTTTLMCARAIQAKLFSPGGFTKEVSTFRCGRLALVILMGVAYAAYAHIPFGINLLPIVLCYFLLSGFNLVFLIVAGKKRVQVGALLFVLILLKPSFVLFAYILFGSLDSIFNFRLYLPERVREST